jgi:hypothetical protein
MAGALPAGAPSAEAWEIKAFKARSGLVQLETDWRRIYGEMARRTVFHSYEACLAYVDHRMKEPDQLRCLSLSDGRGIRAICALEPRLEGRLGFPIRVWGLLAYHDHQADAVCADDEARRALFPAILAHLRRSPEGRLLMALGPAPVDSVLWDGAGSWGGRLCLEAKGCRVGLDCSSPFAQVFARLPGKYRHALKASRKRLDAMEGVHFESVRETAGLAAAFQVLMATEASGWKGRAGTALLYQPRGQAFYAALAATLRTPDCCEIHSLHADGRCIAAAFCVRTGSTYALLKTAYDEAYAHLSPGKLLFAHIMELCCDDPGLDWFDQVSDVPWMQGWHREAVDLQLAYLNLGGFGGDLLIALLKLRFGPLRRLAHRLKPLLSRQGDERKINP